MSDAQPQEKDKETEPKKQTLTFQDKFDKGKSLKEEGNALFKAGKASEAIRKYHEATLYLQGLDNNSVAAFMPGQDIKIADDIKEAITANLVACWSNISACHLKNGNYQRTLVFCDKVLAKDADNVKAIFRRGQARFALGDIDKAEEDFKKANQLAPNDPGPVQELKKVKIKHKEYEEKQKKELRGFLQRE
ncbi:hypothetical protein BJ742DRAFT_841394 [Cladochytrium replicatum]|nr:hypothetical protein BJ742DRAFT_841394 [Cladochytrium replicatum]